MTHSFSGCGIAGCLRLDHPTGDVPAAGDVAAVTDALAHRGPHGHGLWTDHHVALGHRRLSILDLGDTGAQPMTRDHLTITYNGELYNFAELRRQLRHHYEFRSGTDTEVVLRAWQHWGSGALDRFNGMYAFAIWDSIRRHLTLVRDRLGVKPLYLYRAPGFVAFASEVQALLRCPQIPGRPDLDALSRHLLCSSTFQPDQRRTLVAGVEAIPPATCLTLRPDGQHRARTYWELPASAPVTPGRDLALELRELLHDSVQAMSMGDVPVGALVSGGLDSSAITAAAMTRPTAPVTAVTITHTTAESDDLHYSRQVATHFRPQLDHHVITQPSSIELDDIDAVCDLAAVCDDIRHVSILANYRSVRDLGLRAVLNGQGADETMGGYIARPFFIDHVLDVRHPSPATVTGLPGHREPAALSPDALAHRADAHHALLDLHAAQPGTLLERAHRLLFHTQLPRILQFEDHLSMRASVEARVPFLDHRIVEWCFSIPFERHIHAPGRQGKMLLRRAMVGLIPDRLVHRAKQVFPFPERAAAHLCLRRLADHHESELRADPLIGHLFALPQRSPSTLPPPTLWVVLALWRWHQQLQHAREGAARLAVRGH